MFEKFGRYAADRVDIADVLREEHVSTTLQDVAILVLAIVSCEKWKFRNTRTLRTLARAASLRGYPRGTACPPEAGQAQAHHCRS